MITAGVAKRIAMEVSSYAGRLKQAIVPAKISQAAASCKPKNPNSISSAIKNAIAILWTKTDSWAQFLTAAYRCRPVFAHRCGFVQWKAALLAFDLRLWLRPVTELPPDLVKAELLEIISAEWNPWVVSREWKLRQICQRKGMGRKERILENADTRHDCGFALASVPSRLIIYNI
jgi:hypothetical protein